MLILFISFTSSLFSCFSSQACQSIALCGAVIVGIILIVILVAWADTSEDEIFQLLIGCIKFIVHNHTVPEARFVEVLKFCLGVM